MTVATAERDRLLAGGVGGLLADFHVAGVLGIADVRTAEALGRIGGEADDQVLLGVALTVRALRLGSVCVDLAAAPTEVFDDQEQLVEVADLAWPEPLEWAARVRASRLVSDGTEAPSGRPMRWVDGLLYLERYWQQQDLIRTQLQDRAAQPPSGLGTERLATALDRLFTGEGLVAGEPDRQKLAAAVCALSSVTVLAGGPGTGKTTTVARLLAVLRDQQPDLRIALAAPTGKAAARLAEAIRDAAADLVAAGAREDAERLAGLEAATLHRLLGWTPNRTRFRHHAGNRLPYDVVVVDEMSMVSLTLMARLLEAVRPQARLVLVGDPNQLSPVEAGAVLADITRAADGGGLAGDPESGVADSAASASRLDTGLDQLGLSTTADDAARRGSVALRHTWRFGGAIGDLAAAIRGGDGDAALEVLRRGAEEVVFLEADLSAPLPSGLLEPVESQVREAARLSIAAAQTGDVGEALAGLALHRVLCAHRRGPYGVSRWAVEVERWMIDLVSPDADGRIPEWYPGRPLLVTANDYEQELYNGDTGVVVATPVGPRVAFPRGRGSMTIAPVRLDAVQTVHAMTVHRAQGSQFGCVTFVVPPADSPLLTRELLYTAVTRAERIVQVVGTEEAIRRAVARPARRASGLAAQLTRRRGDPPSPGSGTEQVLPDSEWGAVLAPGLDQPPGDGAAAG